MNYVNEVEITYKRKNLKVPEYISGQIDAINLFYKYWTDDMDFRESCNVIYMSNNYQVLSLQRHTIGAVKYTIYDVRQIVFTALKVNATNVVIAHNHPSGNLKISKEDISVTNKLKEALKIFDITLLDSLVLTSSSYKSIINDNI